MPKVAENPIILQTIYTEYLEQVVSLVSALLSFSTILLLKQPIFAF